MRLFPTTFPSFLTSDHSSTIRSGSLCVAHRTPSVDSSSLFFSRCCFQEEIQRLEDGEGGGGSDSENEYEDDNASSRENGDGGSGGGRENGDDDDVCTYDEGGTPPEK